MDPDCMSTTTAGPHQVEVFFNDKTKFKKNTIFYHKVALLLLLRLASRVMIYKKLKQIRLKSLNGTIILPPLQPKTFQFESK